MGILRIAAFAWLFFVFTAASLNSASPLQMRVSPAISQSPAWVTVRVMLDAGPDDRALLVTAESASYYRASEEPLEGAKSQRLNVFEFKNLPPGLYEIKSVLMDSNGPRATEMRLAKVEPGFGSQ